MKSAAAPWWVWWLAAAAVLVLFWIRPAEVIQFMFAVAGLCASIAFLVVVVRDRDAVRGALDTAARHGGRIRLPGGAEVEVGPRFLEGLGRTSAEVERMTGEPGGADDRLEVRDST